MSTLYFKAGDGALRRVVKGHGTGTDRSREITDLEWATREQAWLSRPAQDNLPQPLINVDIRMIDDGFFVSMATRAEFTTPRFQSRCTWP